MQKSIIPGTWEVPQPFRNRLGSGPGRQRAMTADGHLLLVLHAPPKPDEEERQGRLFWRDPEGEWKTTEQGRGTVALENHLNEYSSAIDVLEQREQ